MGFGYWVAEEKATGAFLGEIGFADYQRDLEPRLDGVPEAGWVFVENHQIVRVTAEELRQAGVQ